MRVVGIDPSSTCSGVAVVETPDKVLDVAHWKRGKRDSHPQGLQSWFRWLESYIAVWEPQMAAIEMLGVERNASTARMIAFYQGCAALCCKMHGLVVVEVRVSTARSIALGNGGMSKEEAFVEMKKRYPKLFSPKTSGGYDEADSLIIALAGPTAAEKR